MVRKVYLRHQVEVINDVFNFFTAKVLDREYYLQIKTYCMQHPVKQRYVNENKLLESLDVLTKNDYNLFRTRQGANAVPVLDVVIELVLEALTDAFVIRRIEPNTVNNNLVLYDVNSDLAQLFHKNGLLLNVLLGFDYIAEKYVKSVFKIENWSDGKPHIGNAFLIEKNGKKWLATNFHVIDRADRIVVMTNDDVVVEVDSINISIDKERDLALLPIKTAELFDLPFKIGNDPKILSEVLTIGYPCVPFTMKSYPLFHLGEVNSFVQDYSRNSYFIFSAKSNPGSSGGPVIDSWGTIVGVITQHFDEQGGILQGKLPYYGAIPSSILQEFIDSSI